MAVSGASRGVSPDDPRLPRVGFAHLYGASVDYVVRKYDVLIGRSSKTSTVDVMLGDVKLLSREHARIRYDKAKGAKRGWGGGEEGEGGASAGDASAARVGDFSRRSASTAEKAETNGGAAAERRLAVFGPSSGGGGGEGGDGFSSRLAGPPPALLPSLTRPFRARFVPLPIGHWELTVLGRNGVRVNGRQRVPSNEGIVLRSSTRLEIAGISFWFFLPAGISTRLPRDFDAPGAWSEAHALLASARTARASSGGAPGAAASSAAAACGAASAPGQAAPQGSSGPLLAGGVPPLPPGVALPPGLAPATLAQALALAAGAGGGGGGGGGASGPGASPAVPGGAAAGASPLLGQALAALVQDPQAAAAIRANPALLGALLSGLGGEGGAKGEAGGPRPAPAAEGSGQAAALAAALAQGPGSEQQLRTALEQRQQLQDRLLLQQRQQAMLLQERQRQAALLQQQQQQRAAGGASPGPAEGGSSAGGASEGGGGAGPAEGATEGSGPGSGSGSGPAAQPGGSRAETCAALLQVVLQSFAPDPMPEQLAALAQVRRAMEELPEADPIDLVVRVFQAVPRVDDRARWELGQQRLLVGLREFIARHPELRR